MYIDGTQWAGWSSQFMFGLWKVSYPENLVILEATVLSCNTKEILFHPGTPTGRDSRYYRKREETAESLTQELVV